MKKTVMTISAIFLLAGLAYASVDFQSSVREEGSFHLAQKGMV
ncbi:MULTISPECIES: hypothetical protein [Bacillus]